MFGLIVLAFGRSRLFVCIYPSFSFHVKTLHICRHWIWNLRAHIKFAKLFSAFSLVSFERNVQNKTDYTFLVGIYLVMICLNQNSNNFSFIWISTFIVWLLDIIIITCKICEDIYYYDIIMTCYGDNAWLKMCYSVLCGLTEYKYKLTDGWTYCSHI